MATKVKTPKLDSNSDKVMVSRVFVKEGDAVKIDSDLASIDTLKASLVVTSPVEGYVRRVYCEEGRETEEASTLFVIAASLSEPIDDEVRTPGRQASMPVRAFTLKAEKLARQFGISLEDIIPSDGNRITQDDVLARAHVLGLPQLRRRELNNQEKAMAKTLRFAKEQAVSGYIESILNVAPLDTISTELRKRNGYLLDPSFALIAWQILECVKSDPSLNWHCEDDQVIESESINLGFTMDVKGNLVIASIANAEKLDLETFLAKYMSLVRRAKTGELRGEELSGSTFTVTSLGAFHVVRHVPVLPTNNSVIIAHSAPLPFVDANGGRMTALGCTYDHRLHSGVKIAKMLRQVAASVSRMTL